MKSRTLPLVCLLCCYAALPAGAQAGLLGLGGHVGYFRAGDHGEKKFFAGAHARIKLPLLFAVEGALDYRPAASREVGGAARGSDLDVTTYPITVSAMIRPMPLLYVLAGVGWYNTTIEFSGPPPFGGPDSETDDNFGSHVGAGVELPIGGGKSLSADVRYVFLDYDIRKLDLGGTRKLDADYVSFQVGLTLEF